MADNWPVNGPLSLEDLSINCFLDHCLTFVDKIGDTYCLKQGITFPPGLCDKILRRLVRQSKTQNNADERMFGIFYNHETTSLSELPLRFTHVTSDELKVLCHHPVQEIDITYCPELKYNFVDAVNQTSKTLQRLQLGGIYKFDHMELASSKSEAEHLPTDSSDKSNIACKAIFNLPLLRCLTIHDATSFRPLDVVYSGNIITTNRVIGPLKSLTRLELCECHLERKALENIGDLDLPNLMSLSLCDVLNGCETALDNLCKLTKLRHLDVSQGNETTLILPVKYSKPTERLNRLIGSMPHLTSLDLSGTNLAGYATEKLEYKSEFKRQRILDMPDDEGDIGLPGNDGRHFEFLGLLNCADEASHRKNIPANKVTGDCTEEQMLLAVKVYMDKPSLLVRAFNYLFNRLRFVSVNAHCRALEGILDGMERNKRNKHIQISGSASLFYIMKGCQKRYITHIQRRRVLACLLDAMEEHMSVPTVLRNGCLTLCHFNIPFEVLYCYRRLISVLLAMLLQENNDNFLLRVGIFLLNSLACQVEGEHKKILGDMGIIEVMCSIIRIKLAQRICDEIMEVCWCNLWNVTDGTDSNCTKFIYQHGMHLFLDCFKLFPTKEELLCNMMGLMGNIAEVKTLRKSLMNAEYVTVFINFLESMKDGIEVSYNAAGVLSHLLSDGEECWTVISPGRSAVIYRLVAAIKRWPLHSKRNINYRSFGPILGLLQCYRSHASQYWAVWALCNLTQVNPIRYCQLLKDEGGLELLAAMVLDPRPMDAIKQLAQEVIDFTKSHFNIPDSQHMGDSDSMDVLVR